MGDNNRLAPVIFCPYFLIYHKEVRNLNYIKNGAIIMTNEVIFIGIILGLWLLEQGIIYAYQIKHTPVEPGYTYLSVATGFNMIFGGLLAFLLLLSAVGVIPLIIIGEIVIVCIIVLAALGGPMFVTQWNKKREADRAIKEIKKGNFHE